MKRAFLIAFVALTLAAIATGDRWFDWLQARLGLGDEDAPYLGYVEGETTLIGPPTAGRLIARPVERGDQLKAGARLFVVDPTQAEAEVARGEAVLREAAARLANLRTGKRPEEQEIVRAQRREAEAALVYAEQRCARR